MNKIKILNILGVVMFFGGTLITLNTVKMGNILTIIIGAIVETVGLFLMMVNEDK